MSGAVAEASSAGGQGLGAAAPVRTPVAIVGMACRLPGAGDVRAFWAALRGGVEGISRFGVDELIASGADPELVRHPDFVPAMGVLAGARHFDWGYFGYSRAEAAGIDPQQRVFLECASAALDDASLDPTRFPGRIGVYGGADQVSAPPVDDDGEMGELARYIGLERDFLATRVAYKLGLRGPAVTVQTACSTSLTAVHLAAASLLGDECDVALAGGVAVMDQAERGYRYEPGGILSPDGHCRPFDALAAGTVPSEGVGVVVLKRLADALRDGDRIAAVLLGSAINNDGAEKMGYTAPSVVGQSEVIRHTQRVAGVDPADIDYVEAHGTATPIGDPVEVAALADAFGQARSGDPATGWCRLGAVKSNLGHTGSAAGVAGLIKTALMLEHGWLVPTLHYQRPNPLQELETTPFQVAACGEPWPERGVRLAAVSSFGVGGTNAHVVLQAPPARRTVGGRRGARVLTVSAASPEALDTMRENLASRLRAEPAPALPEVARSLTERRAFRHRLTVVADSPAEAADLLANGAAPAASGGLGRVAFLFPGHGPLSYPAGAAPYRLLPGFRAAFDEVDARATERHGIDLSPVVDPAAASSGWFSDLTRHHLGLFALGYALGRQLADWGVRPAAMLGNSVGEYAPATLAGLWTPADAVDLVWRRARAMVATEPGGMAVVNAPLETVLERLDGDGGVSVAVHGTGAVVLAGPAAAMDRLLAGDALRDLNPRRLDIRQASHCAAMDPAAEALGEAVAGTPSRATDVPLVSNATGGWADPEALRGPGYWAEQLRRPVRLDLGAGTLLDAGCDTFVELGPGTSMVGTLRRHAGWDPEHLTIPLLGRRDAGERGLLGALGALWERGADAVGEALADLDLADGGRSLRSSLPAYPFTRHAPEPERSAPRRAPVAEAAPAPRGGTAAREVLEPLWRRALGVARVADQDHFFQLGGESLMAVNLLTQVRRLTGVQVPVATFSGDATFGALVRLVEADASDACDAAGGGPVAVATWEGEGGGRPLFLIADSIGGSLGYRALAEELADDRPVHALELAEPAEGTAGSTRVERLAAHHVAALRRVRPNGPYTLGGWSFGAVLAHEAARQLTRAGERVDAVVCLDAFVQGWRGLPIALDPGFLVGQGWIRLSGALGIGTVGARVRRDPALAGLLRGKARALAPYRPRPVASRAVVFRAGVERASAGRLRARLSPLYGDGVEVHPVTGDHWSLLTQPHVGPLARAVREVLTRVERAGHAH
ncbi:type I polyketide synthase [Streptomyces profundus]|uniref:type I polyketide synthase n=1 Tax=Streptomyces profundus TaxID=2867410 RepID=UPI001D161693|nr:type I polyketide synthase [Streptomyces sp. MA3_2.13]UED87790.1 acyltransferase domain-containing protein [Streptomyces sp. MA3_2.13]